MMCLHLGSGNPILLVVTHLADILIQAESVMEGALSLGGLFTSPYPERL